MDFVKQLVEQVVESKFQGQQNTPSSGGPEYGGYQGSSSTPAPPPNVPYPWVAKWDDRSQRWYFLNEQTGQTSWEFPGYGQSAAPEPGPGSYYGGQPQQQQQQREYYGEERVEQKKDHSMLYGAAGVAAGAIGGAVLMHEGEKVYDDFEEDKYRVEERVEDFPEDAARWTGEKVGEVEQIPDDIEYGVDRVEYKVENGFDNAVEDVVDFPENAAEFVGERVGDVERFGDNMENAYDAGVVEGRDDW